MTLLKGIFTRYLRSVDYVAANEKYGVDIEAAERTLLARGRATLQSAAALPASGQPDPQVPLRTAAAEPEKPGLRLENGCGCPRTGYKPPQ